MYKKFILFLCFVLSTNQQEEVFYRKAFGVVPYSITGAAFSCKYQDQRLKDELDCGIPNKYKTDHILIYTASNFVYYPAVCLDSVIKNPISEISQLKYLWNGACKHNGYRRQFGDGYLNFNRTSVQYYDNSTVFDIIGQDEEVLFKLTLPPITSPTFNVIPPGETKYVSSHIHFFGPQALNKEVLIQEPMCQNTYKTGFMTLESDNVEIYIHEVDDLENLYISDKLGPLYGLTAPLNKDSFKPNSCSIVIWSSSSYTSHRSAELKEDIDVNLATFDNISGKVGDIPSPFDKLNSIDLDVSDYSIDLGEVLFDYTEKHSNSNTVYIFYLAFLLLIQIIY